MSETSEAPLSTTAEPDAPDAANEGALRSFHVVLNADAGGAADGGETLRERIECGLRSIGASAVTIDADRSRPFEERIRDAAAAEARVIVSAGGDGTATALASAIADTDKVLAVLPLGTANLLARDLAIPLDLDEAILAMASMQPRRIDAGTVNGRLFLHKVVVGFAPAIAAKREELRHHREFGAMAEFLRYCLRRLAMPHKLRLVLRLGGAPEEEVKVRAVAVANNAYDEGLGRFFARSRLDRGELTVYTLKRLGLPDLLRLSAGMLIGRWRQDEALSVRSATSVELKSRLKRLQAMVDGEVVKLRSPLRFEIRPAALTVLAPVVATAEPRDGSE
ncbi:diacylglycerol/lipid kinase family protein [Jiella endophytica]|uniref:diacylglycerol/lipid kinase family protein n=1 Tax=Jiella endophytica TaxID=2558362 RepID=UPI001FE06B16|nr:diacylglycerol kinase family protein [Jiella endophytica]